METILWSYIFNFSPFITSDIFNLPIARLTQWESDVLWTSNARLYDVRPSIENMVRPEDVQIVSIMDVH